MKNIEKFEKEITERVNNERSLECSLAIIAGFKEGEGECDKNCEECHKRLVKWMYSEYKEPILTEEEKDIVKAMIDFAHKCGVYVVHVYKFQDELKGVYIHCKFKDKENDNTDFIESPWLPKKMFKGMEYDREYTLEELGL